MLAPKQLFGAASLVDAVIPDSEPRATGVAPRCPRAPASAPTDLAPAEVRSRAPGDRLASEPLPDVEPVKDAKQWDDDLSPELAAVLFAGAQAAAPSSAPAETAAPVDVSAASSAPTPPRSMPAVVIPARAGTAPALPPATPVELTRIEDVRRVHLYAEGKSAPAPDAPLSGKVRYVRVEEPENKGQRVGKRWEYFTTIGLAGQLVREVYSGNRTATDRGTGATNGATWTRRDIRECANEERTYIRAGCVR
jgi:hypothetical protein